MGAIEDVRKWLADVPLWKRLGTVPDEIDELKRRVADLEGKLDGKWPPDVCRFCGERAVRLRTAMASDKATILERWHCGQCQSDDLT